MTKIFSAAKAIKFPANNLPKLSVRSMSPYTLVKRSSTAGTSTQINMRPRNPIPVMALSTRSITSTSDEIQKKNSSGNPCLDLFYSMAEVKDCRTPLDQLLRVAWSQNPLTTLKLICNMLPGGSKYDDDYAAAMFWLHENHPKTLACNLVTICQSFFSFLDVIQDLDRFLEDKGVIDQEMKQQKQKAIEMYDRDPNYRRLHDLTSYLLAECLKSDLEKLKRKSLKQSDVNDVDDEDDLITDASECCMKHMDEYFRGATLLRESIAKRVFPRESYPEYQGVEEADYADRVQDRLRNEFLVPLYNAYNSQDNTYQGRAKIVEKYLEEVKVDKSNIAADALLPHDILHYLNHWNFGKVAELQWKAMVENQKTQGKKGKKIFNNCLAVCKVDPMFNIGEDDMEEVVGLTLLMSELNEEPWKGKVINFSESPELQLIQGDELRYKCDYLTRMDVGNKVDFQKVFDLILQKAVHENLKPEQIVKTVFVFAKYGDDIENTSANIWKTDYEAIQNKFKEKGFEKAVPQIVYWRMCNSDPRKWVMPSTQPGVTMLNDFSDNLVKLFLDNGGEILPELALEAAISDEEYRKLVVVDW